ncbi:HlyD family secretion protein [Ancylobacter sonchi]|uniref:HlyD family secretion protein n=1 Tax=Ancylobacter sonchi TaxID=1937790 RepID=UPI001BD55BA7|nr:HlyD family secretion protein [Ancylobacter sonchi]MBS7533181.1 HlyD family secretion protein [Ancylobacter sonchi]
MTSPGSAPSVPDSDGAPSKVTRRLLRGLLIPLFALAMVLALVRYSAGHWNDWVGLAAVQTTDDAQIRAENIRVASRISGVIKSFPARDFQRVHAGDVIAEIDPADNAAAVAKAEANVAAAEATLANLANQIALQRAVIEQADAARASAVAKELESRQERQRQEALLPTGSGTKQRVEQAIAAHVTAQADLKAAEASLTAQSRQLDVLSGTRRQQEAERAAAQATLEAAKLQLDYTRVVAPADGVVGERLVQAGSYVSAGTSVIALVPLPHVHVIANYKETQLPNVAVGQPVDITVDGLPDVTLRGHVERIAPASGSQFALLPPDNATGNFTKVVQRIPVRIAIDEGQVALDRLRPGMSVVTAIRTDRRARMAAQP